MAQIDVSGYNVPTNQVQDNKGLDQLVGLAERGRERAAALQQQRDEFQQRQDIAEQQRLRENRVAGSMVIDKELDPNKWDIGEKTFDTAIHNKINAVRSKWEDVARSGVDSGLIRQGIAQDTKELGNIYTYGKDDLSKIKEAKVQIAKDLPNINQGTASENIDNKFLDTYMNKDPQTGQYGDFKPFGQIQSSQNNYLQSYNDPKQLAPLVKNTDNVNDFYHGLEKQQVHDSDYTNNKGFVNKDKWSAMIVPSLTEVVPNKTGEPTIDVKHDNIAAIKGADGEPLKVVTPDAYKTLMGNTARAASYYKLYQDSDAYKRMNDASIKETGKPLDQTTDDLMFKNFLYNHAKQNLPTYVSKEQVQKTPSININMGSESLNNTADLLSEHVNDAKQNGTKINVNTGNMFNGNNKSMTLSELPFNVAKGITRPFTDATNKTMSVPYDRYAIGDDNKIYGLTYPINTKESGTVDYNANPSITPINEGSYYNEFLKQNGVPSKTRLTIIDKVAKSLDKSPQQKTNISPNYITPISNSSVPQNNRGNNKSKAEDYGINIPNKAQGMQPDNISDDNWKLHEDIQGDSHAQGGENKTVNGELVNAEGNELILKNSAGQKAIVPKKDRETMLSMIRNKAKGAIDKYVRRLPVNPPKADNGGMYDEDNNPNDADDKNKIVAPANYKPLSVPQRNDWNGFLDYLHTKGVGGSKDLDVRDKSLGLSYLAQYQKENPNTTVNADMIPAVQFEQNNLRKGTQFGSFTPTELKEWQTKNADFVNRPVSPVDNWLGSVTSKLYYPQASQVFTNSEGKEIKPPINYGTDIEAYHRAVKKVDATAKK